MPGPEWTNHDVDERPMIHRGGFGHDRDLDPVPEPAMDHDHDSPDREPLEPAGPMAAESPATGSAPAANRPGLVAMIIGLASKIPLPSLGTERHEMMLDPSPMPQPTPGDGSPARDSKPKPKARPIPVISSILAMKRETRIGLAAVLSFVILVGSLVVNRGWSAGKTPPVEGGKPPVVLALQTPADNHATPTPDPKKAEAEKPEKPADKDKTTEPIPTPADPPKAPEPAPAAPRTAPGVEPLVTPPPIKPDTPHATLGDTPPSAMPPMIPDGSTPGPAESRPASTEPKPPDPKDELPPPATIPTPTPPSAAVPELPQIDPEPKPKDPASHPAPAGGPPTANDLPPLNPTVEPAQAPPAIPEIPQPPPAEKTRPVLAERPPEPIPSPAPVPSIPVAPVDPLPVEKPQAPVASGGPVPTRNPPTLETVPTIEPATTRASTAGALGWVAIPSGGRRIVGSIPIVSTPAEIQADTPRVADGPKFTDDATTADQVEPVVHVVQPGENFWTISKQYYREGRFYKALHAANKKQVPKIDGLYVGTVLRIPPPEALDRALIDPAGRSTADEASPTIVSRTSSGARRPEPAAEEVDLAMPSRRPRPILADPEATPPPPRRPTYKVKARETLRGIARDTLGDPTRYREIFNLNRDTLETINTPLADGTTLTLPADASAGRRPR